MTDVLLLGATGNIGRMLAVQLAARGLAVGLAGRNAVLLAELDSRLALEGARTSVQVIDTGDPRSLVKAAAAARSLFRPSVRLHAWQARLSMRASPHGPYVDIANEWQAVRQLLDRDATAREQGVTLVTGAGFGWSPPKRWSCS